MNLNFAFEGHNGLGFDAVPFLPLEFRRNAHPFAGP